MRFPGQWEDASWTGGGRLYYNVHRWYKLDLNMYSAPDPLGLRGGINLFSYAQANPIRYTDPFGLACSAGCPDCKGGTWFCYGVGGSAFGAFGFAGGGFSLQRCRCLTSSGSCDFLTPNAKIGAGASAGVTVGGCLMFGAYCTDQIAGFSAGADIDAGIVFGGSLNIWLGSSKTVQGCFDVGLTGGASAGISFAYSFKLGCRGF